MVKKFPIIQRFLDISQQLETTISKITKNLNTEVRFLQPDYEYKRRQESKFSNTLELLKIVRTGKIFHDGKFVYHPHYIKNSKTGSFEYYLPVIYPPTTEIMNGFCKFLDSTKYKYIWLDNNLDPITHEKQVQYGQILTFPIREFTVNPDTVNDPICLILAPNNKEGFSFTFNPILIALGMSETAGDEEQIYGRILRKYGKDGWEGNYDKKIYQYFSGDNRNTSILPNLANLYSLEAKTIFRGMYDKSGFKKSTGIRSLIPEFVERFSMGVNKVSDFITVTDIFVTEGGAEFAAELATGEYKWNQLNEAQKQKAIEDYIHANFRSSTFINDESQLSLLYQVKTKSLDFFAEIANKEHSEINRTFGKWILSFAVNIPQNQFIPLDVREMIKTSIKEPKKYCIENLKEPLYINDKLNISNAIVCLNTGIANNLSESQRELGGGNKKHKLTKKKNKYNKNKKTRKYKKY